MYVKRSIKNVNKFNLRNQTVTYKFVTKRLPNLIN